MRRILRYFFILGSLSKILDCTSLLVILSRCQHKAQCCMLSPPHTFYLCRIQILALEPAYCYLVALFLRCLALAITCRQYHGFSTLLVVPVCWFIYLLGVKF